MSVPRPLPVFLSVLLAIGLWVYGAVRMQANVGKRGVYAALVCDGAYTDPEIRGRLDGQGLTGLVSESDQWFLLDCFGYIEKIPLVEYEKRLLPFDPRNDGYAQKLRTLFVRDGKRFVYIPLASNNPENLEMKISHALTGIPYSLEYAQSTRRNFLFPLIMFLLVACAFFAIPPLRRLLNAGLLPCLPALSPLALGLAPGFALVSLLAGFAALITEQPDRKASAFSRLGRGYGHEMSGPLTSRRLLAFALIACYWFVSVFSGLPFFFTLLVFVSFCCVLAVSNISANSGGGFLMNFKIIKPDIDRLFPKSRRFNPVEILSRRTVKYNFFPVMLPFAAIALVLGLALLIAGFAKPPPLPAPASDVPPLPQGVVSEADFREHYFFQYTFSFMALGKPYEAAGRLPSGNLQTGSLPAIAGYELSSNGLIDPASPVIDNEPLQIPDFPLGDLLRGLSSNSSQAAEMLMRENAAPVDLLLALAPLLFILPAFIFRIRIERQDKYRSCFSGFYR